jgi:hypothetical protein
MGLLPQSEIDEMVDVVNGLANAVLVEIAAPGPLASNGDPGTPVVIWTGEAPGVLERKRSEGTSGEREAKNLTNTLRVYDAVAPADELAGASWGASTVVIRDETRPTPVTTRWTVQGTAKETEGTLDSITLELDGETTA